MSFITYSPNIGYDVFNMYYFLTLLQYIIANQCINSDVHITDPDSIFYQPWEMYSLALPFALAWLSVATISGQSFLEWLTQGKQTSRIENERNIKFR